ncbi:hypothetical protein MKW92_052439 [Papaver armeniacum]|nr:hypothetical protein MKW92_052439 [Papaver armeniacum]
MLNLVLCHLDINLREALESEKSKKSSSMEVESVNELSPKAARAQLLGLAASHLPGLDPEAVKLLNTSVCPALEDSGGLLQKKASKILSIILKHSDEFLSENIDDLLQLLLEVLPLCHFSAKCHRLQCLYFLIVHISKSNKKIRNMAYEILVQIGHACGDEDQGGNKEFVNLGLLKVLVARSPAEWLQTHLRSVVDGLLRWQDDSKKHFKAKVKLLLEMLVNKCGLDAVKALMPEEHIKLLKNRKKVEMSYASFFF